MIKCKYFSNMAKRIYIHSAILCFIIILVASVLRFPYPTTHRLVPHSTSSTAIELTTPPSLADPQDAFLIDDHGPLSHVSNHIDYQGQRARLDRRGVIEDYNEAVKKGNEFLCLMRRSKQGAQAWIDGTPGLKKFTLESAFNDPDEIEKWGWSIASEEDFLHFEGDIKSECYKLMKELNVLNPQVESSWASHRWVHMYPWEVERPPGSSLPSEGPTIFAAGYTNFITKDKGNIVFVVDMMFSPAAQVSLGNAVGPAPDLGRTSDMWFLQYYKHGQKFFGFPAPMSVSRIPAPRHIFIQHIITAQVKELFERLRMLEGSIGDDGKQFLPDSREGMMLMGTAHGMSVGWFLIQHKDHFGDLEVKSIRIWFLNKHWSLYFEIGEAEMEDQAGDAVARARL